MKFGTAATSAFDNWTQAWGDAWRETSSGGVRQEVPEEEDDTGWVFSPADVLASVVATDAPSATANFSPPEQPALPLGGPIPYPATPMELDVADHGF